jgi:antirestriction protein ArdC
MTVSTKQYQAIQEVIIKSLEQALKDKEEGKDARVIWRKGWNGEGFNSRPHNAVSGHPYKGLNTFILSATAAANGWSNTGWITKKNVLKLGGRIKADQWNNSTLVFFWKFNDVHISPSEYNDLSEEEKKKKNRKAPFIKFFFLYNVDQTEDVKLPKRETVEVDGTFDPVTEAQKILDGYINNGGPKLSHVGGDRAYYQVRADAIVLPLREQFKDPGEYYGTAFHEAGHSTGHQTRLNRFAEGALIAPFGSEDYSKEELVAEFTAAFLNGAAGITNTIENSAAYIRSWLKVLQDDPSLALTAASKAQKAADLVLASSAVDAQPEEPEEALLGVFSD